MLKKLTWVKIYFVRFFSRSKQLSCINTQCTKMANSTERHSLAHHNGSPSFRHCKRLINPVLLIQSGIYKAHMSQLVEEQESTGKESLKNHNQTYHKYSLHNFKLIMYLSFHPNTILETSMKYLGLSIQL